MLTVSALSKKFSTRTKTITAVDGISFEIGSGEILAFLGPNGAGKTTTIKMVAGLVRPDSGKIFCEEQDLWARPSAVMSRIGAVLEGSRNLYWRLTVEENLMYWGSMRRVPLSVLRKRASALLEMVGLQDRARNTVQTLSRGMQQKVALCQALMHQPKVLLLDEPTLGLDFASSEGIKQTVRDLSRAGTAILLTTHQLDVAQELSHRVAIVKSGRIVLEGRTADVLSQFSHPVYRLVAQHPWPEDVLARLAGLPWEVAQEAADILSVSTPADDHRAVYEVLAALAPHPLVRVERHQADLTEVFRTVIGGEVPA